MASKKRINSCARWYDTVQGKPLDQLLFEERRNIAEIALQKSEIASYDAIIELIAQDINALSEKSIAVREEWEEKHELSHPAVLKAFAPTTVARLRQEIAPLMQWRNTDGFGDALALDLLTARMQIAVFRGSKEIIDLLGRLASLQMHLNPVREKAEAIQRTKLGAFLAGFSR